MGYVKIPKVYEKLKRAEEFFVPVIMTAATGWGKSAAADYYYRRKKHLTLYCKNGKLSDMPSPEGVPAGVVIVEDLQWLTEEDSISYLQKLLRRPGIQVVMLTRGGTPNYLMSDSMDLGMIRIQESDFAFGEKEVDRYFHERGIEIHPEDISPVTEASQGYACALHFYAERMEDGTRYSEDMHEAVWHDIYRMWDGYVYDEWTEQFTRLVLCVCQYDGFTQEMAEYLTGDKDVGDTIEFCYLATNQLRYQNDGSYSIRPETIGFYRWKQNLVWTKEEITENFRRAADYYERKNDVPNALKYYHKANAHQRIKELLIRNANSCFGTMHLVDTKEYYFSLPEEEIKNSPILMAGMSMLCDLLLMAEKSEEWYGALLAFEQDARNRWERRREARSRLAYLDLALPHRGTTDFLQTLRKLLAPMQRGEIDLPEFHVTGGLPSLMNGALDFSQWSKSDTQIARFLAKPVEGMAGAYGKGLITIALAESGFEKGTMSSYEVLTRCNDGYAAASCGGKIEICFAALGVQVRQHVVEGQLPSAKRVYEAFLDKVALEGGDALFLNLKALGAWISLYGGAGEKIRAYIEAVPDAKISFCIPDIYRQMVKVRCLIAENRLEEAMDLALFLTEGLSSYERRFYWMENELLKSILLYRMGDGHWRECFLSALRKAGEYYFIRPVSIEGAAILPLLENMKDSEEWRGLEKDYLAQLYKECIKVASHYPDYMRYIPGEAVSLTNREAQVLSMLCAGLSMDEICRDLKISYAGLKKHNRNIYKKLGAKNRTEAERKAIQSGLVHRG
ncbi:MAG: hypothetical protein IJ679_12070 [Lachnospiraceae bacterium]|nr:hypothetical protein [Lachnospiraceae bacterium]